MIFFFLLVELFKMSEQSESKLHLLKTKDNNGCKLCQPEVCIWVFGWQLAELSIAHCSGTFRNSSLRTELCTFIFSFRDKDGFRPNFVLWETLCL